MKLAKPHIDVGLATNALEPMLAFWRGEVGLPFEEILPVGCGRRQHRHGLNGSVLEINHWREPLHDPAAPRNAAMDGPGFRYVTLQVWDVDAGHRRILARGGREGLAPVSLGDVARISFVRDPDGNWLEISRRASLTGCLPPAGGARIH